MAMADVDPSSMPSHQHGTDSEKPPVDPNTDALPVLTLDKPTLPEQTKEKGTQEQVNVESQKAEDKHGLGKEQEEKPEVPPKDTEDSAAETVQGRSNDVPPEIHEPEPSDVRARSDSRSTTATFATQRGGTVSSTVFILTALDTIATSREARKSKELEDAVQVALDNVKQSERQPIDPELIFRPLHLASKSLSVPLQVTALDCIGKLITYSYFAFPSAESETEATSEQPPLIERAIDAICDCFENEATSNEIQQQIIK